MIKTGGRSCVIEVPALTKEGEEFALAGVDFSEDAIGRVDQVLGQGGGKTRIMLTLIRGEILYQNNADDAAMLEASRASRNPRRGGSSESYQKGGAPLPTADLRPRSGSDNRVVKQDVDPLLNAVRASPSEYQNLGEISKEEHLAAMAAQGINVPNMPSEAPSVGGGRRSKINVPKADRIAEQQSVPNVFVRKQPTPDELDGTAWGHE